MNYNPRMGFSEQDYHLLKTHQSSGGSSAIKQELLTDDVHSITFDNQHNYMFDLVCDTYLEGSYSFAGSTGCTISKVGSANPSNVEATSRMTVSVTTNTDNGTRGQIIWGGVMYAITCASGSSWTITLPDGRFYNGVKTEVGDPGVIL